jgi:hypothetical protein
MRRTSLFFFLEVLVDDPDEQKGLGTKFLITLVQCVFVLASAAPLLGLYVQIGIARSHYCGSSAANCSIDVQPMSQAAIAMSFAMLLIGFIELFQYFADGWVEPRDAREEWIAERRLRRLIRWAFYALLGITLVLSVSYLMVIITWIVLGTISDLPRCVWYFGVQYSKCRFGCFDWKTHLCLKSWLCLPIQILRQVCTLCHCHQLVPCLSIPHVSPNGGTTCYAQGEA